MKFPDPIKAKVTDDGKFRLSLKIVEDVIIVRDLSLDEARMFLAQAQAVLRDHELKT